MAGKGSKARPFSVDRKTFESNWDRIFKKNKKKEASCQDKLQKQSE
jgi:hypothetical protein